MNASEQHNLMLGQRSVLQACKEGDVEHLRLLAGQEKINPNFQEPGTGRTPFSIALQHNPQTAKVLLTLGARPHLYLRRTQSIYSESFELADEKAIDFLRRQHLPYVVKKNRHNRQLCQTLDLERLLAAGNIRCLRKAFKTGIIPPTGISSEILNDLTAIQKRKRFARQALSLLLSERSRAPQRGKDFNLLNRLN